ncbi:TPA: hypothetical protein ACXIJH_004927 [Serratia marcescens]
MKHPNPKPVKESESSFLPDGMNLVLGENINGMTVVSINANTNVITLRNVHMTFNKTGLPNNFKWRD